MNSAISKITNAFGGSRYGKTFHRPADYFSRQTVAGYIGWLGNDNLGDEALYESFRTLFPDSWQFVQFASLPIELLFYRRAFRRRSLFDLVFLGGGTLINDNNYLNALQKAIKREGCALVFGTGVRDPDFWSEARPNLDIAGQMSEWVETLRDVAHLSVRGPQSASALERYGLPNVRVSGDPALSLCEPRPSSPTRSRLAAINLGCSGPMWGTQPELNGAIAALTRRLLREGWEVEFIPMHPIDVKIGHQLIQEFDLPRVSIWKDYLNIPKTLARLADYDFLIGQRLHAAILAAARGVPVISLEYRPKCGDFMDSVGMEHFTVRTNAADEDRLWGLVQEIDRDYAGHCQKLNRACNALRDVQREIAREITALAPTR